MHNIYCQHCQSITPHELELDGNNEIVARCRNSNCDRFIKFAYTDNPTEFAKHVERHHLHNKDKVHATADAEAYKQRQDKLRKLVGGAKA